MAHTPVFIPDVSSDLRNWTVNVTITEELPTLIGRQRGTQYKRFILSDEQGYTVPAIVYGRDIATFAAILHIHGVYLISNAQVKSTLLSQNMLGYSTHWVLQRDTIINPLRDELPNLRYFLEGVKAFNMLVENMNNDGAIVDIMAVVIKADPPKTVPTNFGPTVVQEFTLVDTNLMPISLSVWEPLVEHYGEKLTTAASTYSVVVVKRVKVKSYRGISLSSTNGSSFTLDVPLPAVDALSSWFNSVRELQLPNLLANHSIEFSKNLVDRNLIRKYSVAQIQSAAHCGDFWTRAFLQLSEGEQRLYYIGCNKCYNKVNATPDTKYHCLLCNKDVVASIRPRVSMDVFDQSGRITVGALDNVAEQILRCPSSQPQRLLKQSPGYELEPLRSEFNDKMYLMLLRSTINRQDVTQRRMLLIAFYEDVVAPETIPIETAHIVSTSSPRLLVQSSTSTPPVGKGKEPMEIPTEVQLCPPKCHSEPVFNNTGDSSTELFVGASDTADITLGNTSPNNTTPTTTNPPTRNWKLSAKRRHGHHALTTGNPVKRALLATGDESTSNIVDDSASSSIDDSDGQSSPSSA